MGDQEREIEGFLGKIQEWQKGRARPFATIFWPGQTIANRVRPTELDRFGFHKIFQPTVSSYHFNITQDRICSGGPDTLDEFWYQGSSYSMVAWALGYDRMMQFFETRNSQDANVIVTNTSVSGATVASLTLTCAAGHAYKVVHISGKNSTRAPTWTLDLTPNGGTAAQLVDTAAQTSTQGQAFCMLGNVNNGVAAVGGVPSNPIWLQAGDTLTITNTNFVAADVTEHNFVYEDYTL